MAAASGGTAGRNRTKNAAMAARMKALGIIRKTQRCPNCYRIVSREILGVSSYSHLCKG
jgi:hypothetical protein